MKIIKITTLTAIFAALPFLSWPFTANALVNWTKDDANNPVLEAGSTDDWDEDGVWDHMLSWKAPQATRCGIQG